MASSNPLNIKSAARKLPIKRKNPPQSQPQPIPLSNPNPNPNVLAIASSRNSHAYDDDDPDVEYGEEDGEDEGGDSKQPPFKFHRIWPESDEIRFLQGLLGCWSQGLVFPRDLNIFYDRFSESMSQPYTRSQLSEKLRRLRKKYRTMAGRIARGQDPSRLSQHDRDLLHLSTRLWDPSNAASSPFSAGDAVPAGTAGNKRRRPNPRAATGRSRYSSSPPQVVVALESAFYPQPRPQLALPSPASPSRPAAYISEQIDAPVPIGHNGSVDAADVTASREDIPTGDLHSFPTNDSMGLKMGVKHITIKSVLSVFDEALNEARAALSDQGIISSDDSLDLGSEMKMIYKKIQEQRLSELDLLARRWRLLIEQQSNKEQI